MGRKLPGRPRRRRCPHPLRQSWWWTLVYQALALLGVAAQWPLTFSSYTLDAYNRDVALA